MAYLKGTFDFYKPILKVNCKNGILILGAGKEEIKIDSGFDGCIVAPKEILNKLDLIFVGQRDVYDFQNKKTTKDVFIGKIIVRNQIVDTYFMVGDFLLGMELADDIFKTFKLEFEKQKFTLVLK